MTWSSTVADYLAELRRLGPEQFLVSYPFPVLIHRFNAAPPPPRADPKFRTDLLSRPARVTVVDGSAADLEVSVHAVKKRPGIAYEDTVMLGRAATNDIVVPYADLSKLHAYFVRDAGGAWLVADAGSTNGTWMGDTQLAANTPAPLAARNELAFGENVFELFSPQAFAGWLGSRA